MTGSQRTVTSPDGVQLAVYESGPVGAPPLVAVHGYPDDHTVWDRLAALLQKDFRIVTYDVRGCGASTAPSSRSGYRIPRLVDDLVAVLGAVSPERPVHLLGHDWGSVQLWPALLDERLAGRVSTFTSVSGPSIDYAAAWLRQAHRHPRASLRQLVHSYYTVLFQVPRVPEALIQRGVVNRLAARAGRSSAAQTRDELNGLELYRANLLGRLGRPALAPVNVPVQLIVPERDPFVTPELAIGAAEPWVPDLRIVRIPAGHWVVGERPEAVAGPVREFAAAQTPTARSRAARSSSR